VVDGAEIDHNNLAGAFDPLWDAGGMKVTYSNGIIFRRVYSHHNNGPGLWYDINNQNSLLEDNIVEFNTKAGIFYEISMNGIIRRNTVTGNGTTDANHTGANILVSASRDVQVYENTVSGSHGIIALQEARGNNSLGQVNQVVNLNVHDNMVTVVAGKRSGMLDFISSTDGSAMLSGRNNVFNNNSYTITGNTLPFYPGNLSAVSKTAWQGFGQDVGSTFTTP
jgi:parallel beta-helix repeat protein